MRLLQFEQRTQTKLRLRALLRQHRIICPYSPWITNGKKWLLDAGNIASPNVLFQLSEHYDTIEFFTKKIAAVEKRMTSEVADDPVVKQLLQQPGNSAILPPF